MTTCEPDTRPSQQERKIPITPDRDEAERFLTALDPRTKQFTFQTFDDDKERREAGKKAKRRDPLAKVLHGTLAQHGNTLVKLNEKGAGIFVTINETDLQGRTYEHMTGIRSVFADLDGSPLEPVISNGLKPHIVTETSPGRFHTYWRVDPNPLGEVHSLNDMEQVVEQFSGVQNAIAERYGGDDVHDLPRVMRLPGFVHRKGAPFASRIIAINKIEPYAWNTVLKAFPPVAETKRRANQHRPPDSDDDLPTRWKQLNSYALDQLDLWVLRLFPAATKSRQGWRVSSAALGRNLEEDISFTRGGIVDFGVHDMGDVNQGRRTAIDIVEEWNHCRFEAAVRWLCQAFGFDPREYLPGKRDTENPKTNGQAPISEEQQHTGETAAPPSEADELLSKLNANHCIVLDGARTMVLRLEETEYDAGGEHHIIRVPTFLRFTDFRNLYLHRRIKVGEDRSKDWGKWWLTHPLRRQYKGVIFKPGAKEVVNEKLNLWRGWGVEPKRGDWGLLREHIFEVLAARDEDVDTYTCNWMAWAVQHPAEQAEVALVFIGDRGTGKGTLGKAMCETFGQHALHLSSPEHLTGRFNAHLRQCSFLFGDECYGPKDKSAEGTLKRLITEDTLTIEAKGRDPIEEPNRLHVMLASNNEWVVPAGAYERRFVVQRVADTHRQDAAWFGPIYKQMRAGGYEAMLFDLLHRDLGDWHPRQIVRTAALAEQQEESLSPLDAWWLQLLQTAVLAGANSTAPDRAISNKYEDEISESDGLGGTRRHTVKRDGLYDQARAVSPKLKGYTDAALGRYLKQQGCGNAWVRRNRGWQFPPLAECRHRWLERFPMMVWHDSETKEWTTGGED
jgi:Family of unknown function (DUF5906)/RepB DNA-primase from phage plasmid